jgi:hypothetical protein
MERSWKPAFSLILLVASAGTVHAATYTISPGATTIQDAVASAAPGDSVVLLPGTYFTEGSIVVRKPVTILSQAGPDVTIVDLHYNFGSVFYVSGVQGGPTIQGLTIKGGAQVALGMGSGILAWNSETTIVDNLIYDNWASNMDGGGGLGAGITIEEGTATIRNNTMVANFSSGGALFLWDCGGTVDHNVFAYNGDPKSIIGGIYCQSSSASITDNMFWANPSEQVNAACGAAVPGSGNVIVDPLFCNPNYPPSNEGWHVRTDSPLAPGHEYAGWGASLPLCASTASKPATWGSIKARYR